MSSDCRTRISNLCRHLASFIVVDWRHLFENDSKINKIMSPNSDRCARAFPYALSVPVAAYAREGRRPVVRHSVDATGRPVTRTPGTIANYRARYPALCRSAGLDPANYAKVVDWFVGEHRRWARSTISQYRAAIAQAIEDASSDLAPDQSELLFERLKQGPSPRKKGAPRTSARKRKSIRIEEFVRLIDCLLNERHQDDDKLAARLLNHNVRLFLRPSEWEMATIQRGFLIIRNGKATNGRALGTHRRLDLKDYGRKGVRDLTDLLATLRKRAAEAESFNHLWGSLASRIARACEQIRIKRVAPYSTRHAGMANAKNWMSPEEVAASAGHKTTATATAHYAKRRAGWRVRPRGVARPSAEDVEKVIRSPKASRETNREYARTRIGPEQDTSSFRL
jgi:hypothetical protein